MHNATIQCTVQTGAHGLFYIVGEDIGHLHGIHKNYGALVPKYRHH